MQDERQAQVNAALRRGLVLLVAFAAAVALGTWVIVHALGLNGPTDARTVVGQPVPVTPLPTTALPVPGASSRPGGRSGDAGGVPASARPAPRHHGVKGLRLTASPGVVGPMERINLTGTWPGHDNVGLQVQRLENGAWADFPTQGTVQVGTFETYVRTGHAGVNEFRVLDPASGTASNSVRVRVR